MLRGISPVLGDAIALGNATYPDGLILGASTVTIPSGITLVYVDIVGAGAGGGGGQAAAGAGGGGGGPGTAYQFLPLVVTPGTVLSCSPGAFGAGGAIGAAGSTGSQSSIVASSGSMWFLGGLIVNQLVAAGGTGGSAGAAGTGGAGGSGIGANGGAAGASGNIDTGKMYKQSIRAGAGGGNTTVAGASNAPFLFNAQSSGGAGDASNGGGGAGGIGPWGNGGNGGVAGGAAPTDGAGYGAGGGGGNGNRAGANGSPGFIRIWVPL